MGVIDTSKNVDPQFEELLSLQADQRYQFTKRRISLEQMKFWNELPFDVREEVMLNLVIGAKAKLKLAPHHR